MVSKIVFFILTVLKLHIAWTAAFLSNVHEMMTPEEISQTFGTDDGSVPDYQLVSLVSPRVRKRQIDDKIRMKVKINDTEINLKFKPIERYLATRYTPVWLASTDDKAYNKIRYDPLPNAMLDIGSFKMYQDVDNEAAIVVYTDEEDENPIIEGIVTLNYAIKSLPKRLMHRTLNVGDNYFIESPLIRKRSIEQDVDEVTGHYVLFKSSSLAENAKRNLYKHVEKRQVNNSNAVRHGRPTAVYPEILLVLDHNAIRHQTITQALRFMLAFWNAADMVYSTLDDPEIYLNIAGIIISADDAATPYISEDTSIKIKTHTNKMQDEISAYFAKELVRFPLRQYDIIVAMTSIQLCAREADPCRTILGYASINGACTSKRYVEQYQRIAGVAIVNYNWTYVGVDTAVHETAHLFNVHHDEGAAVIGQCNYAEGYVMAPSTEFRHQGLKWSPCSQFDFRYYFSLRRSECLDNTPRWTNELQKVLPGRWLTLDGQCRNSGFNKSCQISDAPVCDVKRCTANDSSECKITKMIPLPGTKCGKNKYCNLGKECVNE